MKFRFCRLFGALSLLFRIVFLTFCFFAATCCHLAATTFLPINRAFQKIGGSVADDNEKVSCARRYTAIYGFN